MLRYITILLLLVCQAAYANQLLEKQRDLYIKAEQTLKQGQRTFFVRHQGALRDYPLYPYLLYADMARRIAYLKSEAIVGFLRRYDDTPIADKMRHKWLKHLAARKKYDLFAQHYRDSNSYPDKALACFYAQSLLQLRRLDELRALSRQLWLVNFSQPPECDSVFRWGKQSGVIDQDLVWQRIILVLKGRRLKLANYLAAQSDTAIRKWYVLLKQSYYHPFRTLARMSNYPADSAFLQQVLLYSMSRAQTDDIEKAHAWWQKLKPRFKPYPLLYEQVSKGLGIAACRQLEPEIGLSNLSSLRNMDNDKDLYYWHIRCALRLKKWNTVLDVINALDPQEQKDTRWLYWKARALERLGNNQEAIALWRSIAAEASYYGYLAADRIRAMYALSTQLPKIKPQVLNKTKELAAVKRISELFVLHRVFDVRRELFYLLPEMSGAQRLAIAMLCRQWGRATCMIEALGDPMFWHKELGLRFPMPYPDIVTRYARLTKTPEHWIYAVMRRESAFMEDVKSPVGALGLMQLMPTTAERTARRLGLKYSSSRSLLQPHLNIRLGSSYLQHVYRLNDNKWVSALASYNAGYHRAKQWKSQTPVYDTDIWIETIPFTETRRYLRAVLFYAVVYYYKLHHKTIRLRTLAPTP